MLKGKQQLQATIKEIHLRRAEQEDCRQIFQWRNHSAIRPFFFEDGSIAYKVHERWFKEALQRPDRIILMACQDRTPVGVIRFDLDGQDPVSAQISIYVDPGKQARGIGTAMLNQGAQWLQARQAQCCMIAKVKPYNTASIPAVSSIPSRRSI